MHANVRGGGTVSLGRRIGILGAGLIAVAVPAAAYQIGSNVPKARFYDLHETFTAVAQNCLRRGQERPQDCSSLFGQISGLTKIQERRDYESLQYASRWPDDPTRMLERYPSKIAIGVQLDSDCRRAFGNGRAIDSAGLLCSSHFGRLQFMHAQARQEDGGKPAMTRENILAWADFAYRAATEPAFRAAGYCETVEREVSHLPLRQALTFDDRALCKDRPKKLFGLFRIGTYPAWTVRTFFALQCPNPVQQQTCWERTEEYGDASARRAAIGALLHLVQDSYSQSHVARVPEGASLPGPRGPFMAQVVCRPPSDYYDYEIQNQDRPDNKGETSKDPHALADRRPELHTESCGDPNRKVDDVLTASAAVLHFVQLPAPDPVAFRRYLATRVFPG